MAGEFKYRVVGFIIGAISFFLAVYLMPLTLPYIANISFLSSSLLQTIVNWLLAYALAAYAFPNILFRIYVSVFEGGAK